VDGTGGEGLREGLGEVADGDRPVLGLTIEEVGDVAGRDRGEFLTDFEGVDAAGRSDGAQQGHRQRSGAAPGLDDGGTGVDVAEGDDESRVLRVHDSGTPRHRQHEVLIAKEEDLEVHYHGVRYDDSLGAPYDVIVADEPLVRV